MEKKICKWKRLIACLCAMAMVLVLPVPVLAYGDGDYNEDGAIMYYTGQFPEYLLSDSQKQDDWSYDASIKTLTLNGVDAAKNMGIDWYSDEPLTIIVNGNNQLCMYVNTAATDNTYFASIDSVASDVIIKGNGVLNVDGINVDGSLIIQDRVNIVAKSLIHGKKVVINNGNIVGVEVWASEFEMNGGNLNITVKPDAQAKRVSGIHCFEFNLNGGKIAIHGDELNGNDYSLDCLLSPDYKGDAYFNGGQFTGDYADISCRSISLGDNMAIASGKLVTEVHNTKIVGDKIVIAEKGNAVPVTPAYTSKTGEKLDQWAQEGVNKAIDAGLMPECLKNTDLTKNITRAQFAALAVTLYEKMGGEAVSLDGVTNPFTDTQDSDVLKAYALGITTGTSSTAFSPNSELTREAAATMLLRVYSKLGGKVEYKIEPFADDVRISDWAKEAVYFMADKEIVNGVGDNNFNPKGNAQSQQTLMIALRMLDNLSV